MKNSKIFRKIIKVLTVEAALELISSHLKWPTKEDYLEVSCLSYTRRINYDLATVNISVFIQQRNISFQSVISQKAVRFGVL